MEAPKRIDFTSDQLAQAARAGYTTWLVGIAAWGKRSDVQDLVRFVGDHLTVPAEGTGAMQMVTSIALAVTASGGVFRGTDGDDLQAAAFVRDWPPLEAVRAFGIDQVDADTVLQVFAPAAKRQGYALTVKRNADEIEIRLQRAE